MNTFDLNTLPVLRVAPNRYVRVTGLGWCPPGTNPKPTVKFCLLHGEEQTKEHELELAAFLDAYTGAVAIQPLYAPGQVYTHPWAKEPTLVEIVSIIPDDEPEVILGLRNLTTGNVFFADAADFQKEGPVLVQIH